MSYSIQFFHSEITGYVSFEYAGKVVNREFLLK